MVGQGATGARSPTIKEYMTPVEVAERLRISVKTLANWRSSSLGPPWLKVGGRVVYPRAGVLTFGMEIRGSGQQGKPKVTITTRPAPRDKSRYQVDIQLQHPGNGSIIRKRPTAPKGMDEAGARAWGERQVPFILREIFETQKIQEIRKIEVEETKKTESRKNEARKTESKKSSAPTLGELWDRYDAEILSSKETKKTTARGYRTLWKKLCPIVKHIHCDRWDKDCTNKLVKALATIGPRSANQTMVVLRQVFEIAVSDRILEDVPRLPRREPPKRKPMVVANLEDTERLLEAARRLEAEDGEAYPVMLLLGVDGGLRPGEVSGIRWCDIDWRRDQLLIQNQRPLPGPEDEEILPKYDEVGRVAMGPRLRVELEKLRARTGEGGYYVLRTYKGEAFYTSLLASRIARIHKEAGMPIRRGHHLRHISASLIDDHPDSRVADVQAHLRHRHESTTAAYLHAIRGSDRTVRVGRILGDLARQTGTRLAPTGTAEENDVPASAHSDLSDA
jgi:integrase